MTKEILNILRELQIKFREKEEKAIIEKRFDEAHCYMMCQHDISVAIFKILEDERVEE